MDFFTSIDWGAVLKIIGIDILLGGDNAVLIALAAGSLPLAMQNKAIAFGTAGAVIARIIFLAVAAWLLTHVPFIHAFGGALLIYIAYTLVLGDDEEAEKGTDTKFWAAVWTIVVADIMMSIDNVVAITAASQSAGEHAIWYSIAGIAISIPIIVFASKVIMAVMEKLPILVWLGGALLGWIGAEMIMQEPTIIASFPDIHSFTLFWSAVGAAFVVIAGGLTKLAK